MKPGQPIIVVFRGEVVMAHVLRGGGASKIYYRVAHKFYAARVQPQDEGLTWARWGTPEADAFRVAHALAQ